MHRILALVLLLVAPVAPAQHVTPPEVAARNWLLLDLQSQQVLASHAANERLEPASLTKLMSAYVLFDALKQKELTLEQTLLVSVKAWRMPGSRMFLEPATQVRVEELLRGMIVVSGNDATIALAEGLAGSEQEFVRRMAAQAQRLGLTSTRFANATGLPEPQHYSTVSDLARLASALMRDFPQHMAMYHARSLTHNRITQPNRNWLLARDPRVDGLKTGYTESAGFCLIATARHQERRLLAIVAGAISENARASEAQRLLNHGFQHYDTLRLYSAGATVAELPVWKGNADTLRAGLERDLYISVPRGQGDRLKATLTSQQPLLAPVSQAQRVGVLRLAFDATQLGEYPVVALEGVSVANIFVRIWDSLRLLFD
jgi:D-alanyl-D-alanine carboxypeptidase (penicillin-binding protein 5/6)